MMTKRAATYTHPHTHTHTHTHRVTRFTIQWDSTEDPYVVTAEMALEQGAHAFDQLGKYVEMDLNEADLGASAVGMDLNAEEEGEEEEEEEEDEAGEAAMEDPMAAQQQGLFA
jgi:hypothetical protein